MNSFWLGDVVLRNRITKNSVAFPMEIGAVGIVRGQSRTHVVIEDGFEICGKGSAFIVVPMKDLELLEPCYEVQNF